MLLLPCGEFQWPDSKAHRIAWVQGSKLLEDQLDEMVGIGRCHSGRNPGSNGSPARGLSIFNDGSNNFSQGLAITQPENIRWHEVLLDRHVLLAGPFVRPLYVSRKSFCDK
jgi:hypothetical protein